MSKAALFDSIALDRADGRCECEGDCGRSHKFGVYRRCPNSHGRPAVHGSDKVVALQVRPLDGDARNLQPANLIAMCQTCTRKHREKVKRVAARVALRKAIEAQHEPLFDIEPVAPVSNGLTL